MITEFEKQLKRGMLDIIILNMLSKKSYYGYELLKEIKNSSEPFSTLKEGTLYPRLYRLLELNLITCVFEVDEEKSKLKKVYSITPSGKEQLDELLSIWRLFVKDMKGLLEESK